MSGVFLTLDLGNTRCKLCVWTRDEVQDAKGNKPACVRRVAFDGDEDLPGRVAHYLGRLAAEAQLADVRGAVLSSVAGKELTAALFATLESVTQVVTPSAEAGLENRTRVPAGVGRDRLYAARGALEELGRSAIVVDAGTALTVDAVQAPDSRDSSAGHGIFLGGAIAPGPELLAASLAQGAANLPLVTPAPDPPALGRETEEAIRSGVVVGFRGAARELVQRVAAEAGWPDAPVVLTGGARAYLLLPEPFTERELFEREDLVHRGLLAALQERT